MSEKTYETSRQDATYVAPIVPKFANVKEAFLADAMKPYLRALQAAADTHQLVQVPIPETFRIENGTPTVDYVTIDVRGTGSPMQNVNPEFALLTLTSNAGLKLIDKATGITYDVLGKTGRNIAKSVLTGEASNQASKALTGKTYGQHLRSAASLVIPETISNATPNIIKEVVSEGLNPFYYNFGSSSPFIRQLTEQTINPKRTANETLPSFLEDITALASVKEEPGIYDPLYAKTQALQGLQQLKQFYSSPAYRQRVLQAYPHWSAQRISQFVQNRINLTDKAIQRLTVNRRIENIGNSGQTTIASSQTQHYPVDIEVAADAPDPILTGIHEGLHFTSIGGKSPMRAKAPTAYEDPDATAISNYNQSILPRLTKSWYKKYVETNNLAQLKQDYHDYVKFYYPYLTDAQIAEAFERAVIKEGTYYNMENELHSIAMAELLKAVARGEVRNPNDYAEVLRWLFRIDSNGLMSPKLSKVIHEYRPDLREWATYLTKALSIGSVPIISNFNDYETNSKSKKRNPY